jgi:hypothetical protein
LFFPTKSNFFNKLKNRWALTQVGRSLLARFIARFFYRNLKRKKQGAFTHQFKSAVFGGRFFLKKSILFYSKKQTKKSNIMLLVKSSKATTFGSLKKTLCKRRKENTLFLKPLV